jgi:hypothetical protein
MVERPAGRSMLIRYAQHSMLLRFAWSLLLAIPIGFALSLICYVAFCLTLGPWGGAMDLSVPPTCRGSCLG